jgi:hypothetical protein
MMVEGTEIPQGKLTKDMMELAKHIVQTKCIQSQVIQEDCHNETPESRMTFSALPLRLNAPSNENGRPTHCFYCGLRIEASAIRHSYTSRYFCSDSCLDAEEFIRSTVVTIKTS